MADVKVILNHTVNYSLISELEIDNIDHNSKCIMQNLIFNDSKYINKYNIEWNNKFRKNGIIIDKIDMVLTFFGNMSISKQLKYYIFYMINMGYDKHILLYVKYLAKFIKSINNIEYLCFNYYEGQNVHFYNNINNNLVLDNTWDYIIMDDIYQQNINGDIMLSHIDNAEYEYIHMKYRKNIHHITDKITITFQKYFRIADESIQYFTIEEFDMVLRICQSDNNIAYSAEILSKLSNQTIIAYDIISSILQIMTNYNVIIDYHDYISFMNIGGRKHIYDKSLKYLCTIRDINNAIIKEEIKEIIPDIVHNNIIIKQFPGIIDKIRWDDSSA